MGMASSTAAPPSPSVDSACNGIQNLKVTDASGYYGNINQVLDQVLKRLKLQEDKIAETNRFLDDLVIFLL